MVTSQHERGIGGDGAHGTINRDSLSRGHDRLPIGSEPVHRNPCCGERRHWTDDKVVVRVQREHGPCLFECAEASRHSRPVRPEPTLGMNQGSVVNEIRVDTGHPTERCEPPALGHGADAVVLDRETVIEPRLAGLEFGEGIEGHIDRLIAVCVRVDLDSFVPVRPHGLDHVFPRNLTGEALLAIEVAREVKLQCHRRVRSVVHELHPVHCELIGIAFLHRTEKIEPAIAVLCLEPRVKGHQQNAEGETASADHFFVVIPLTLERLSPPDHVRCGGDPVADCNRCLPTQGLDPEARAVHVLSYRSDSHPDRTSLDEPTIESSIGIPTEAVSAGFVGDPDAFYHRRVRVNNMRGV